MQILWLRGRLSCLVWWQVALDGLSVKSDTMQNWFFRYSIYLTKIVNISLIIILLQYILSGYNNNQHLSGVGIIAGINTYFYLFLIFKSIAYD